MNTSSSGPEARRPWSSELETTLRKLRAGTGLTLAQLKASNSGFEGKSLNAIAKKASRHGWVDPDHSARVRAARHFDDKQHQTFIRFIEKHRELPLWYLVNCWNNWAEPKQIPTITQGRIHYWLQKISAVRSRKGAWNSPVSRAKRKANHEKRQQELAKKRLAGLETYRTEVYAGFAKRKKEALLADNTQPLARCHHCRREWPAGTGFFKRMPAFFSSAPAAAESRKVDRLQTELCLPCCLIMDKTISVTRANGGDWQSLAAELKHARRKAYDRIHEEETEALRKTRDQMFVCAGISLEPPAAADTSGNSEPAAECGEAGPNPRAVIRTCVKCNERWPLTEVFFMENRGRSDGSPTFRGICRCCDNLFKRLIDRARSDGESPSALIKERNDLLLKARDYLREQQRLAAAKLRGNIRALIAGVPERDCPACGWSWPIGLQHRSSFWYVRRYCYRGRESEYLSSHCRFCVNSESAVRERTARKSNKS